MFLYVGVVKKSTISERKAEVKCGGMLSARQEAKQQARIAAFCGSFKTGPLRSAAGISKLRGRKQLALLSTDSELIPPLLRGAKGFEFSGCSWTHMEVQSGTSTLQHNCDRKCSAEAG